MKYRLVLSFVLLASLALAIIAQSGPSDAHETRDVDPYVLVFGWRVEPAFVGEFNGPELFIYDRDPNAENGRGDPIYGAEAVLKLKVSYGPATKVLKLRPAGDPGHYIAELIPTRAGDYTFHLTGSLTHAEIDETFSSADGKFGSVEPITDILFPDEQAVTIQDLQAQIDELRAIIDALQNPD